VIYLCKDAYEVASKNHGITRDAFEQLVKELKNHPHVWFYADASGDHDQGKNETVDDMTRVLSIYMACQKEFTDKIRRWCFLSDDVTWIWGFGLLKNGLGQKNDNMERRLFESVQCILHCKECVRARQEDPNCKLCPSCDSHEVIPMELRYYGSDLYRTCYFCSKSALDTAGQCTDPGHCRLADDPETADKAHPTEDLCDVPGNCKWIMCGHKQICDKCQDLECKQMVFVRSNCNDILPTEDEPTFALKKFVDDIRSLSYAACLERTHIRCTKFVEADKAHPKDYHWAQYIDPKVVADFNDRRHAKQVSLRKIKQKQDRD